MPLNVTIILSALSALTLTILSFIFIIPQKKRNALNGFFKALHDIFNFKFLLLETIMKFTYVLSTMWCLCTGFWMLFSNIGNRYRFVSGAPSGIMLIIVGPIAVRIAYELIMMAILAVKNLIELNNKTKDQNGGKTDSTFGFPGQNDYASPAQTPYAQTPYAQAPYAQAPYAQAPAEDWGFCAQCGTKYNKAAGNCPNCGK